LRYFLLKICTVFKWDNHLTLFDLVKYLKLIKLHGNTLLISN
jgi:hypothetical protein